MRINCKKIPIHKITEDYLYHKYIIIKTKLVYKRYCGIYECDILNHVYVCQNENFISDESGFYFPCGFLKNHCEGVYEISENDYKLFTKCKNKHEFDILWDNLYFECE